MESFKLPLLCLDEDTLCKFSQDDQVQDDGSGQQRVLACVVQYYSVVPSHEDLRGVLIHSSLAVPNIGHILDHNLSGKRVNAIKSMI